MNTKAIEDYAEAVQNYFGQKRGASLLASPDDFLKIEEWFEKGIPLRTVKKGLDRHFEKIDESRRLRAVVIRFAEGAILTEWEIMKSQGAGPTGKASPEDEAAERKEHLDVFFRRCRKAHTGAELWVARLFLELVDRTIQAIQTQCGASTVGTLKPLSELAESFDEHIAAYLRENTTPERMRTARRTAARDLAPFRDRMDPETYKEVLETNTLEALRIELGIPKLMEEM